MGRKYIPKPGTKRRCHNYPNIQEAIDAIESKEQKLSEASKTFNIPMSTLHDKIKKKYTEERPGRKTALSPSFENQIVDFLQTTSLWGFPQNTQDLINFVEHHLLANDIKIQQFRDGVTPGKDWVNGFLDRKKDKLSERWSNNIKRARAQLSSETIDSYFNELERALEGIEPNRIFNYDESNLQDDPGKKKFIFKRGVKYPDRVINFTKSSISFMMCSSADGCVLPPYVCYKAKNVHPSWKVR